MTTTTTRPVGQAGARWTLLLRPRWLAWHSIVIASVFGMLLLGDWQLHRAESGNELSWAYTFEWPLFSAFTVFFWIKSLHDELREPREAAASGANLGATGPAVAASDSGGVATGAPAATATAAESVTAGSTPGPTTGSAQVTRNASVGRHADSWDATSWNAASWDATGVEVGAEGAGKPADVARATPADGDAYMARLMAEVQGRGRRRGGR
jgi:hypothetical protein